jgi:hypothetical protein
MDRPKANTVKTVTKAAIAEGIRAAHSLTPNTF